MTVHVFQKFNELMEERDRMLERHPNKTRGCWLT
ncbi:MAG: hypothetical protein Ct9H300mP15_03480 [Gemmatimonadota bacterium]|nr:MAG: hypothetical protein Ct9H300mP15_03480 [Gemmatimonadota bacterium]